MSKFGIGSLGVYFHKIDIVERQAGMIIRNLKGVGTSRVEMYSRERLSLQRQVPPHSNHPLIVSLVRESSFSFNGIQGASQYGMLSWIRAPQQADSHQSS